MKRLLPLLLALLPAAPAAPLPVTHEGASCAVAAEREAQAGASYRYTLRFASWEGRAPQLCSFVSPHRYGHAYAHGGTVVFTNSGEEGSPLAMALVSEQREAQEIELQLNPLEHGLPVGLRLRDADEAGTRRLRQVFHWHRRDGWKGGRGTLCLRLGEHLSCPLEWYYEPEGRTASFVHTHRDEGEGRELPMNSRPLELQGSSSGQGEAAEGAAPCGELLATTLEEAACALRVAREAAGQVAPQGGEPPRSYSYTVQRRAWEGGKALPPIRFRSPHKYGQAYACGGLLLLSTSAVMEETGEEVAMAFALIDLARGEGWEEVLQPDDWAAIAHGLHANSTHVHWDRWDEDGVRYGGSYSYRSWHLPEGVEGSADGFCVQLGETWPVSSKLSWEYDAATGKTCLRQPLRYRLQGLLGLGNPPVPRHRSPLELEGVDSLNEPLPSSPL